MLTKTQICEIDEELQFGNNLHKLETLNQLDRIDYESSPDGQHILIEAVPSVKDDVTRWANSMSARLEITEKQAQQLAYSVKVTATNLSLEIRKEVEKSVKTEGYEKTSSVYRKLALEMLKLEPKPDGPISFKSFSSEWLALPLAEKKETDESPLGLYETAYSRYVEENEDFYKSPRTQRELHDNAAEHAENVVASRYRWDGSTWFKAQNIKTALENLTTKIRHAGIDRSPVIGKKLYEFSKTQRVYSNSQMSLLFSAHERRKEELRAWKQRQKDAEEASLLASL
jgi:hypothetical protein